MKDNYRGAVLTNLEIEDMLISFSGDFKREVWAIQYNGSFLTMPSGKSSWGTLGAAKNAWHNGLYYWGYGGQYKKYFNYDYKKDLLAHLIESGKIKFINLYKYQMQTLCEEK